MLATLAWNLDSNGPEPTRGGSFGRYQPTTEPNISTVGDALQQWTTKWQRRCGFSSEERLRISNDQHTFYRMTPVEFVLLLLCCVASNIGHHVFCSILDGIKVRDHDSQQQAIRFSTAFTFLVQIPLAAVMSISQTQRACTTVESKLVSIGNIDSIFAATRDLTSFISWDIWAKVKLASLIALIC